MKKMWVFTTPRELFKLIEFTKKEQKIIKLDWSQMQGLPLVLEKFEQSISRQEDMISLFKDAAPLTKDDASRLESYQLRVVILQKFVKFMADNMIE